MWRNAARNNGGTPHTSGGFGPAHLFELRVRPDFRKTVVFGLVALAALIAGYGVGGVHASAIRSRLIAYGCAVVVGIFGVAGSRTAAREVHRIAVARAGEAAGTPLRLVVLLGGYLVSAIVVCDLVGVELSQLLVGGAITGIILGLAAQPVLSNLFAGLVLLFARPYVPGQRVRVMSGAINGPHVGAIVSAGLLYTVLDTADGPLNIPNSSLLASAVGPAPTEPSPAEDELSERTPSGVVAPPTQDGAVLAAVVAGAEAGLSAGGEAGRGSDRKHIDA
ncbi:mechanosensitive ion channel family protein [Micromonospora yasonensis]|uniref:mechanosensitive ion channel family protein n=1 Tax=Micromonospora yasonensis TaxID=1128667 RepID=UPI0022303DBB|nr:mechanosensitive ion channel family protein [Micromonospora yasonensis]MCW3842462.1 mechanosensitive ion channel family protein [Micromonospora yasonensis]